MRHFQVDAHIYSKREIKRIARKTGRSRSEVVGAMVCLWGYVAVHSRDSGTIEGDYEDLCRRTRSGHRVLASGGI